LPGPQKSDHSFVTSPSTMASEYMTE